MFLSFVSWSVAGAIFRHAVFAHVLSDVKTAGLFVFNNPGMVIDSFKAQPVV